MVDQALQDRFDDQSVTLRLTKEANAELQVRRLVEFVPGVLLTLR